jgi:predicted peptidase
MVLDVSSTKRTVPVSIAMLLYVAAACGGDTTGAPAGPSSQRVERHPAGSVEGAPVGYVEYVPPGYGDGEPRPLLVFLHGAGEIGDGSAETLDRVFELGIPSAIEGDRWPDERPFVVLAPQFPTDDCAWTEDLDRFVGFAIDRYDVDPERVYLTGISCGGIATWNYLGEHGEETIAASVIISAQAMDAFASAGCELGRTPIWVVHGAKDDVVPLDFVEGQVEELRACTDPEPVDLRFTVDEERGHDAWDPVYEGADADETFAWLLDHRIA